MESIKERGKEVTPFDTETENMRISDLTHEAHISNESMEAFERVGLPLQPDLRDMLSETSEHRFIPETFANNRRGSGFMQATRLLAETMQLPVKDRLKRLFDEQGLAELRQEALRASGEFLALGEDQRRVIEVCWKTQHDAYQQAEMARREHAQTVEERVQKNIRGEAFTVEDEARLASLQQRRYAAEGAYADAQYETSFAYDDVFPDGLPKEYRKASLEKVRAKVKEAVAALSNEEDVLTGRMIHDLLEPRAEGAQLPSLKEEVHVGTCTTAETYFLSALNPDGGYNQPTIVPDASGEPYLLLKHAGEHSALSLKECVVDGVRLPPGALMALSSEKPWTDIRQIADCTGVQFLRLTTLAISPKNRTRAFGMVMDFQERNGMYGAKTVSIEQLQDYAKKRLLQQRIGS